MVNRMTYDNYGNIKTKNGITYTYGDGVWKDLLTGYNGQTITYDAQGNPTNYMGKTAVWEKGRQLKAFDGVTFTYNANGIRTSKTLDGRTHTYTLDGTKILEEYWVGNALIPLYDNEDSVCGITYNGTPYYFLKNLQGDVIAITDKNGDVVARYTYDAWGLCTIVSDTSGRSIATINPFRYRGYYYDNVTCLYYLQSRYYDPKTGRFLNSDAPEFACLPSPTGRVSGANAFAYCLNNPITDIDLSGCLSAQQAAAMLDPLVIFGLFTAAMLASYSKGLVAVGAYVTKVITPVVVKAFWWKPWAAAAIIVAAVAIVVAGVAILYSNRQKEIDKARKKIPKKLIKDGKVDLSQFNKKLSGNQGIGGPDKWRIVKDMANHAGKAWKLYKALERIASLLEDGTIYGK